MATWVYRCQSCGGTHEVSVRPAGAMLLRCSTRHEWAWHDVSAFVSATIPVGPDGARKESGPRVSGTARAGSRRSTARAGSGGKKRAGASRSAARRKVAHPRASGRRKTRR